MPKFSNIDVEFLAATVILYLKGPSLLKSTNVNYNLKKESLLKKAIIRICSPYGRQVLLNCASCPVAYKRKYATYTVNNSI
jgi:hypothetical protein